MRTTIEDVDKKRKEKASPSTSNPKRRKQPTQKRKTPTPSASEGSEADTQSDIYVEEDDKVRNEDEHIHNKEETSNPEVTQNFNDSVPFPPTSPKTTSILITIALCLPPVSSQQKTSIPLSISMFTDSIVPPTTSTTPFVSVNVSDMGAKTSGFSTHVTPFVSPHNRADPYMIFYDAEDEDHGG
ncbi:unnamed protein product [Lactuca saligna]|uniref:Uncharacterized protein n=1 Tax=Lactuca saligna TaxID=75948 RepID=A0AA35VFJ0_LACSI|nr:unnamed protein product [Lactuca saligna]